MTNYGTYTYNTTIEVQFPNNLVEWEVSIEMNCIHPGDPGKLSGPPEDCCPPEGGEFEWESVHVFVGEHTILDTTKIKGINKQQRIVELVLGDKEFTQLEEAAHEEACNQFEPEEDDCGY